MSPFCNCSTAQQIYEFAQNMENCTPILEEICFLFACCGVVIIFFFFNFVAKVMYCGRQ